MAEPALWKLKAYDSADEEFLKIINEIDDMPGIHSWKVEITGDFVCAKLYVNDGDKFMEDIYWCTQKHGVPILMHVIKIMRGLLHYARKENLHVNPPMPFMKWK